MYLKIPSDNQKVNAGPGFQLTGIGDGSVYRVKSAMSLGSSQYSLRIRSSMSYAAFYGHSNWSRIVGFGSHCEVFEVAVRN